MDRFDPKIHDDNPPLDATFLAGMQRSRRGRPRLSAPKVEVKIRLDANTVEQLRSSGPGWQTRVNAVLGRLVTDWQISTLDMCGNFRFYPKANGIMATVLKAAKAHN